MTNEEKLKKAQEEALTVWTIFNHFVISVVDGSLNVLESDTVSFDYRCRDLKRKLEEIIFLRN